MKEIDVYKVVMTTIEEDFERRVNVSSDFDDKFVINICRAFHHKPLLACELFEGWNEVNYDNARQVVYAADFRIEITAALMKPERMVMLEAQAHVAVDNLTLLRRHIRTLSRVFTNYKTLLEAI